MKNTMKVAGLVLALGIVAGCALTPAQKAAQAQEKAQQMLDTQVSLANQCSPTAANLMREMPNSSQLPEAQQREFEAKYLRAVNNPAFKACYNLAWKDYREQNAIQAQRMADWTEASDEAWDNGFFFDGPGAWGGWGGWY